MFFLILKISAIVFLGGFTGLIIFLLLSDARKSKKSNLKSEKKTDLKFSHKQLKAKVIAALNENNNEFNKIRFYISFFSGLIISICTWNILAGLLFSFITFYAIKIYISKKEKNIMEKFNEQLLESLEIIANSVKAGQSLMQALENMVKDAKQPLKSEFEQVLKQIRLGQSISNALLDVAGRIKSRDLKIAINAINLARESGGNLGEILLRIANTMRERKRIQGKILALTAQGKLSGIVIGIVPFILLGILYLIEPNMMGLLFTTLLGNAMLVIAVLMLSAGMFFINKIINIDI